MRWQILSVCAIAVSMMAYRQVEGNCDAKINIGNEKRSTAYRYTGIDPLCDDKLDENAWYHFDAHTGSTMPETCVMPNRCGTAMPIYLRATHPPPGFVGEVVLPVSSHQGYTCLDWNATVRVMWCDGAPGHYIYQLTRAPGCQMAYCAGDGVGCPVGQSWNSVQGQCMPIPQLGANPTLQNPLIVERRNVLIDNFGDPVTITAERFAFRCSVGGAPPATDDGLRYRVMFLFDGNTLPAIGDAERLDPVIIDSTSRVAELSEMYMRGRFGRDVSCSVRPFWEGSSDQMGDARESNRYWAGIKATLSPVVVDINQTMTTITMQSTVPVTCWHCAMDEAALWHCYTLCMYKFTVKNDWGDMPVRSCEFNVSESSTTGLFHARVIQPMETIDPTYQAEIPFMPYDKGGMFRSYPVVWNDYRVKTVLVRINDNGVRRDCETYGDPGVITFDKASYVDSRVGTFYLLTSDTPNSKFLEIQVRWKLYGSSASTNCAIAVREGNSVLQFDACEEGKPPKMVRTLGTYPDDGSSITHDAAKNEYYINMPSGLYVKVYYAYLWQYKVYLPNSYSVVNGMCGNNDNNPSDDLPNGRFSVPDDRNMFTNQPQCMAGQRNVSFCKCEEQKDGTNMVDCKFQSPASQTATTAPIYLTSAPVCNESRDGVMAVSRSQLYAGELPPDNIMSDEDLYYNFTEDWMDQENITLTWPTPLGKTEAEVRLHCQNVLRSSAVYDQCTSSSYETMLIDSCTFDVQATDDYMVVSEYYSMLEAHCVFVMRTASTINSTEEIGETPIAKEIESQVCPKQCSGQGRCVNGTCLCNEGFVSFDCSMIAGTPPIVTGIYHGGLCDYRQRRCSQVNVFVSNVMASSSLVCRYAYTPTDEPVIHILTNGTLMSLQEMVCPLPVMTDQTNNETSRYVLSSYHLKLSVSNDGVVFSSESLIVVYDSNCTNCQSDGLCTQKSGTCLVENICYADRERHPSGECMQCIPERTASDWTDMAVWTEWSACSVSCDAGVQSRELHCTADDPVTIITTETRGCWPQNCTIEPPLIPDCGDILHNAPAEVEVPPGWSILCHISKGIDEAQWNRECRDLLIGLPRYDNADGLMANGGNFGCWATAEYPTDDLQNACHDNYQHNLVPAYCHSCQLLAVCIRFQ